MRRLSMKEVIACTVFGVILGVLVRPQRARVYTPDGISREELATTIIAVATSVAVSFVMYLLLVKRTRT